MSHFVLVDTASYANTIIDHPPEAVWPHLLNQAAWMKDFVIERVAGAPNTVGEIKKVLPSLADAKDYQVKEIQPFYFKTLALSPFRRFLYKAYTLHRGGEYGFTGIEILTLQEFSQRTAVAFEVYLEWESATMREGELRDFLAKAQQAGVALWERNFQRLNALVDHAERR